VTPELSTPDMIGGHAEVTPTIFYLIGFPGTGKFTVAKAMESLAADRDHHLVVVDNHYINNPIFGVININGSSPLADDVWHRVAEVGEAVFKTIETLSPREWSFVFTNHLDHDDPAAWRWYRRLGQVARARHSRFCPVRLLCGTDELCRRVTGPGRRERFKMVDPEGARRLAMTKRVFLPTDVDVLSLDITDLGPYDAAQAIFDHPFRPTSRRRRWR